MRHYIAKLLIFSLSSLFAVTTFAASNDNIIDYIVATVNEQAISYSALEHELAFSRIELQQANIPIPEPDVFKEKVLQRMIVTMLQLQVAKTDGLVIDDTMLNDTLRNIAKQNNLDLEGYRQILEQEGYAYEEYRERLREEMTVQHLRQKFVFSRINVTEQEVDNFLTNQIQRGAGDHEFHILHILIATPEAASPETIETQRQKAESVLTELKSGADFRSKAVAVSDSSQASEGGDLGWRKAGEVPSLFAKEVVSMKIGEIKGVLRDANGFHIIKLADKKGQIKSVVTQTKARHILIKTSEVISDFDAKSRLKELRQRIELGEDFAELARTHSEDTASAVEGGDLGWVSPNQMVPEF